MSENAATSRQASGFLIGSFSGRRSVRTCAGSVRVSQNQSTPSAAETAPMTSSGVRQPPAACASGTATAAATVAPAVIPIVYTPVANPGRSEKRSFTATGNNALPRPIPIPIGTVITMTPIAPGTTPRAMPNTPISTSAAPTAPREPIRPERNGAGGANSPMQRTGIVPSNPATACETPRSLSIDGRSGPTPTSCGRRVRAARNSATRSGLRLKR